MSSLKKELIERARKGDTKAGTALLEQFVDTALAGEEIDENILQYTAHCLRDILNDQDPQTALNIKKPAVVPGSDPGESIDIAVSVELCSRIYKENKVKAPVQLAIETVAEAVGKSCETVRGIRKKYNELAKRLADRKPRQEAES
jgi:hypothetical protein